MYSESNKKNQITSESIKSLENETSNNLENSLNIEELAQKREDSVSKITKNALKNPSEDLILGLNGSKEDIKRITSEIDEEINQTEITFKDKLKSLMSKIAIGLGFVSVVTSDIDNKNYINKENSIQIGIDATPVVVDSKNIEGLFSNLNSEPRELPLDEKKQTDAPLYDSENKKIDITSTDFVKDSYNSSLDIKNTIPSDVNNVNETGERFDNQIENLEYQAMTESESNDKFEDFLNLNEPSINKILELDQNTRNQWIKEGKIKEDEAYLSINAITKFAIQRLGKLVGVNIDLREGISEISEYAKLFNKRKNGILSDEEILYKDNIAKKIEKGESSGLINKAIKSIKKKEGTSESDKETIEEKELEAELFRQYSGVPLSKNLIVNSEVLPKNKDGLRDSSIKYLDFSNEIKEEILKSKDINFDDLWEKTTDRQQKKIKKILQMDSKYRPFDQLPKLKIDYGEDENGRYISYYKEYKIPEKIKPLNININIKDIVDINKYNFPFEVYGRLYEKDFTNN